jgi:hypothetical protein
MDRDSSALSNPRFAGCLRVVPLLQTLMVGSNTRHSTPLHGVHTTTEGHLGVYPAALRVRVCEKLPQLCCCIAVQIHPPCEQCRWESQQCTGSLPIHAHPPMRLAGYLSEAHTSGETQTLEARGIRHPSSVLLCGKALRRSEGTRLQGLERAQQLTRAVHAAPNAPLSVDERCDPAGCPAPKDGQEAS